MSTLTSSLINIAAIITILLVPFSILAEDQIARIWNNRLFLPTYGEETNLHTPIHTAGTYLPSQITDTATYTIADNPLILTTTTTIPIGVTITFNPGVKIIAHEFATLRVKGTLVANGTETEPIIFTTNELHPENKNWGGIIVHENGQATLSNTRIEYASPALSCLPQSFVAADHLHIRRGLVGLHTESSTCTLSNSRIQALQYGVVSRNVEPKTINTNISAGKQNILTTSY